MNPEHYWKCIFRKTQISINMSDFNKPPVKPSEKGSPMGPPELCSVNLDAMDFKLWLQKHLVHLSLCLVRINSLLFLKLLDFPLTQGENDNTSVTLCSNRGNEQVSPYYRRPHRRTHWLHWWSIQHHQVLTFLDHIHDQLFIEKITIFNRFTPLVDQNVENERDGENLVLNFVRG